MIKRLKEIGTEGYLLNMIKCAYLSPKAHILFHGETLEVLSLRSRTSQELNIVPNALASAVRQERPIGGMRMGKEVKLPLFEGDMIVL